MHDSQWILDPGWVMLGAPFHNRETGQQGVMVLASQSLTLAEIKVALEHVTRSRFDPMVRVNSFVEGYELSCTMRDCQMAYGDSYGEAIQNLFSSWNPDASPERNRGGLAHARPAALAAPAPALEPAPVLTVACDAPGCTAAPVYMGLCMVHADADWFAERGVDL